MLINSELQTRSNSKCELCAATDQLSGYPVAPYDDESTEHNIVVCDTCNDQLTYSDRTVVNHWRCLNDSMWSPAIPVQIMSWRMLHRLKSFGWSQDLLDMMYLDEQQLEWAADEGDAEDKTDAIIHRDVNGVILQTGDNVVGKKIPLQCGIIEVQCIMLLMIIKVSTVKESV